jgi:hypothetical protein
MTQPTTGLSNKVTSKHQLNWHLLNNRSWFNITYFILHGEYLHYWTVGLIGNRDLTLIAITQPRAGLSNSVTSKHQLNWHLLNNICWCNKDMLSTPR